LYAITPQDVAPQRLLAQVEAALSGGAVCVQYRDKRRDTTVTTSDTLQRAETARALRQLCQRFGARFIVNDDLALALAVDADGVHLGVDDGDLPTARQALPSGKLLGASCYADFERARWAVSAGADYVAFGAVYPSPTKPQATHAPHTLFARCRSELSVPACAIGGITVDNAAPLLAAGADLLAVITDLFEAPDIAEHAAAYQSLFLQVKPHAIS
jgi:thiamine-phosphate pyrophosphorylase